MAGQVLDHFVDHYSELASLMLLKALAYPSQGGLGYRVELTNRPLGLCGYSVDHRLKVLALSSAGVFSTPRPPELADALRDAVEVEVFASRRDWLYRLGWGSTKVVLGLVETAVGLVGVIVLEASTTAGGVALVILGVNSVGDGVSQIAGAERGEGVNVLASICGAVGSGLAEATGGDAEVGRLAGRVGFHIGPQSGRSPPSACSRFRAARSCGPA
ncbi:MAG: hypothetical protein IPL40_02725 [Proteobacteria bacterium]|nr:hypothetical protein [Pseudomonadota bacterium]